MNLQKKIANLSLGEIQRLHSLRRKDGSLASSGKITAQSAEGPIPLSYAQQRLWFIDQLEGGGAAYHIAGAVRLQGELDVGALGRALDRVLERHESLRTRFVMREGQPRQQILEQASFALKQEDLSHLSS